MSRQARVALYGGGGSPYHHAAVFATGRHQSDFVFSADIVSGALYGFNAFVMPGGGQRMLIRQTAPLGSQDARAITLYILRDEGMYPGSCTGSYCAAQTPERFLAICPAQSEMQLLDAAIWNTGTENRDEEFGSPGVGVIQVRNTLPHHPVMNGMSRYLTMTHYNGPLFRTGTALSTVHIETDRFTVGKQFLGYHGSETWPQRAATEGIANIVVGALGKGRVVLFGSHPEFGCSLLMDDLPDSDQMLNNAMEWQLSESSDERPSIKLATDVLPAREDRSEKAAELARQLRHRVEALPGIIPEPSWLGNMYALSGYGLSANAIWRQGMNEICHLAREVEVSASDTNPRMLGFQENATWNTDIGYHGIVSLLELTCFLLARAQKNWSLELVPNSQPYAYINSNPYHLVIGSYLSAIGLMTGAAILCRLPEGMIV